MPILVDLPELRHQRLVKPLFEKIKTQRMYAVLQHMTAYYNRYFGGSYGEMSSEWLHDHIAQVRSKAVHRAW